MLPSPDILNNYPHGRFVLANLAAKRAKQLREGAIPLVQIESHHPLSIALAEIAAGKIKPILSDVAIPLVTNAQIPLLIEENVSAELGLLLPALDETESALIAAEEEDEHDVEGDGEISLSDLGESEEEDEVVAPVAGEEDTLSLSDLASEENAADDEAEEE